MYKSLIILIIINCFLFSNSNWEVLNKEEVLIKVLKSDYPHCEAELIINHSIDRVLDVVEDIENYKLFFKSVVISDANKQDEVRLAINMPFPFTDRDYTIKFRRLETDSTVSYLYNPIVTEDFPEDKQYVRLIDARGGWTLLRLDNQKTLVTYAWNGDMRGDFPNWAYRKSWTKQGNEIMLDLRKEINKRNSK